MTLKDRHIQAGHLYPVVAVTADGFPVEAEVTNNVDVTVTNNVDTTITSPIDTITGAVISVDTEHHEIHEGEVAIVSYKSPDASPIADNGTISFLIQTSTRAAHIIARSAFGGDFEIEIYEGTTFTGGTGTAMTVYNKNRYKALPAGYATVRRDVTVTLAGTLLFNFFAPGGSGGVTAGADANTRDEWIFAPGTNYLIRITNRAGTQQPGSLAIEWYEEPAI